MHVHNSLDHVQTLLVLLADVSGPLDELGLVLVLDDIFDQLNVSPVLGVSQVLAHMVVVGSLLMPLCPNGGARAQLAGHVELLILAQLFHD